MNPRGMVLFTAQVLLLASPAWSSPSDAGAPHADQPAKTTGVEAASVRSHTETSGCLAKRATRSKRGLEPSRAIGRGIVVQHGFEHACCLTGRVATTVTGLDIEVVETLSGKPCRCLCTSTLRTSIPVAPGSYHLAVWLDNRGVRTRITAPDLRVVVTAGKSRLISLGEKAERFPLDESVGPLF
jgi:hypothetical protein